MKNLRKYGKPPFNIAVIHGGPGAAGEMGPVARELSKIRGILEPLQNKTTLNSQLKELKTILKENGSLPVTLAGYSWGAMLSFIFTARYPAFVKKLILVSSGVFEDKYASGIMKTRLSRLSEKDKQAAASLLKLLNGTSCKDKDKILARFGRYMYKADSYKPLPNENKVIQCSYDIYEGVWKTAASLRTSGKLLALGRKIKCPVVAIHGDYDPHPSAGIKKPLSGVIKDFRFILLKNCGHHPWLEKDAVVEFYHFLKKEIL